MNSETDERSHRDLPRKFRSFLASSAAFVAARSSLFSIEFSEAKQQIRSHLVWVVLGFSALVFAYLLTLVGGIFLISDITDFPWYDLCLIAAPLHALFGFLLLAVGRRKLQTPLFEASRNEFKKDKEWLAAREEGE